MNERKIVKHGRYGIVVAGGGLAGCCAALAAARHGAKVALIHNRPMLGGNASSESRLHTLGADCHVKKPDVRESGILEELLLENKYRNPEHSFALFDAILWEKVRFQPGLDLFLNTQIVDAQADGGRIRAAVAEEVAGEKRWVLEGDIFLDCTGDASLSYFAGAAYRTGREGRSAFGEPDAPDEPNRCTMGSSLQFVALDRGHAVPFIKPDWAYTFTREDLKDRSLALDPAVGYLHGYWWNELGGGKWDTIEDADVIRDELLKTLFGIWDYVKNGGDFGVQNYELEWVQFLPSKRESRRVEGRYLLTEQDLLENHVFEDAVAYGGWYIDAHTPESLFCESAYSVYRWFDGVYTIPYRCLTSRSLENLLTAGRIISTSSLAHSSTRVMSTCAIVGQAAGTAAAAALAHGLTPWQLQDRIGEVQQMLLADGCFLPGILNEDPADLARTALATGTYTAEGEPMNAVNGTARNWAGTCNAWGGLVKDHPSLLLRLQTRAEVRELRLTFDSDYDREICTTMYPGRRREQYPGVPPTLVRDLTVECLLDGAVIHTLHITGNHQARCVLPLPPGVVCDAVRVTLEATNGSGLARLFEIRLYGPPVENVDNAREVTV